MFYELGGFAEYEEDIDGDFNAFNYCLANEYCSAIMSEDFELLGEISNDLIDKIINWLNYDGEIGKNDLNVIKGIDNGSIITDKNRTFIEAIVDSHQYQIAETYLLRGIHDINLFLTYFIYAPIDEIEDYFLNGAYMFPNDREKYVQFLNSILNGLDQHFIEIKDMNQQIQFLDRIKIIINLVRYPAKYEKIVINKDNYSFVKQIIKNK